MNQDDFPLKEEKKGKEKDIPVRGIEPRAAV